MSPSHHQAELHKNLWSMANSLRGQMEASEFKNYILGVIFYRYLSDNMQNVAAELLEEDGISYAQAWESSEEMREELRAALIDQVGYVVEPPYLFSRMIERIASDDFDMEYLNEALTALMDSTRGEESEEDFENLFDDMDLNSSKLGRTNADRSALMAKIFVSVNGISFNLADTEVDVLGDAYEYLISQFASSAGKKAGEFYTPQQVSKLLAKIVVGDKDALRSVYDPTCGSGSLLLRVARETKRGKVGTFYGQELTSTTYNLARMNMMLHGVHFADFDIKNGNTLTEPQHLGEKFEAIVANPPYSAHWSADPSYLNDERFSGYGKLAPKTKADFAFVQHMLYHLDDNGTMAVVLPHGVLFRGAAEGVIRKAIIEKNYLDAVIGLPANIFYGTSIPTVVMVFKKCRESEDDVLFIDASQEFAKGKNQNYLTDDHVERIFTTYQERKEEERYSHRTSLKEIEDNDYNLNIPRYVDTSEPEEIINLDEVTARLAHIDSDIKYLDQQISDMFDQLMASSSSPILEFARFLHSEVLETAPTLSKCVLAYEGFEGPNSWWITYNADGEEVESILEGDYQIHYKKEYIDKLSAMRKYVQSRDIVMIISREKTVLVYENLGKGIVGDEVGTPETSPTEKLDLIQKKISNGELVLLKEESW